MGKYVLKTCLMMTLPIKSCNITLKKNEFIIPCHSLIFCSIGRCDFLQNFMMILQNNYIKPMMYTGVEPLYTIYIKLVSVGSK